MSARSGGYDLSGPGQRANRSSGYYMLFLLNSGGVPSVAKFVKLGP